MIEPSDSIADIRKRCGDTCTKTFVKLGGRPHLEALERGLLRFRHLGFYSADENRGKFFADPNEGLISVLQPSATTIEIELGGAKHKLEGLRGPVLVRSRLSTPVMCFFAIDPGESAEQFVSEADLPEMRNRATIPSDMEKYGDSVWALLDPSEFIRRVVAAAGRTGLRVDARRVLYADLDRLHDDIDPNDVGFVKSVRFASEKEFRIRLGSPSLLSDPFVLEVGDLQDISRVISLDAFRRGLQFVIPEES